MTATAPPLTRAERLDRLPFTREHGRLVVGSGLGWALDAMDVGLISFVMASLLAQEQWGITPTELSFIGSIGFVGMALGATLGGLLADRFGRRQVFAVTLLIFGVATGAAALSWSVGALLVFRFLIGLGLGAELPVASTLVSEFAPARLRGRVVVGLEAFWAVGWTLAALIGYLVVPGSDSGWRWALRPRAPRRRSTRWSSAGGCRSRCASSSCAAGSTRPRPRCGASSRRPGVEPVPSPLPQPQPRARDRARCGARATAGTPAALWAVWFCINFAYYGAFIWLPVAAVRLGLLAGQVVRLHADHHAGPAARVRGRGLPDRAVGTAPDADGLPHRVGGRGRPVLRRRRRHRGAGHRHGAVVLQPRRLGCALRRDAGGLSRPRCGPPAPAPRPDSAGSPRSLAPLCVPPLLELGGSGLVFGTFAAFFVVAAAAALGLPERRGQSLEETAPRRYPAWPDGSDPAPARLARATGRRGQ